MAKQRKAKTIMVLLASLGFLLLFVRPQKVSAQSVNKTAVLALPGASQDTVINGIPASLAKNLEERTPKDIFVQKHTRPVDASMFSKDSITSITDYKATDSSVFLIKENKFFLYKESEIKNPDADITANTIEFNKNTNIVKAYGAKDTSDAINGRPTIVQNGSKTILDTAYFNVKT
ncbi:MAG TPA: hypothetical protein VGB84_09205, partial [Arachidicoccus sp.]